MINRVTEHPFKKGCAVVCPDEATMNAVLEAERMGLVAPFFYLDESRKTVLDQIESLPERGSCVIVETPEEAAKKAVQSVHAHETDKLLKGNIDTAVLLKQVVNKSNGMLTGRLITHVGFLIFPRILTLVNGRGMVIYPT